jgi:capsid protein
MSDPDWNVRGWEWVDPLKDINASVVAIENGLSTRTLELAKQGLDFEEVLDQLAFEKDLAAEKGVVFPGVTMDTGNGNQNNQVSSAAA